MGHPGFGKRKNRRPGSVDVTHLEYRLRELFLDSGAHSLYNLHAFGRPAAAKYDWYYDRRRGRFTKAFQTYLDGYVDFLTAHPEIKLYATVDVIYNPELSWASLKYLESQGLSPVPVIHHRTPWPWVQKHLDHGYDFLGIGGLGQESPRASYTRWADDLFSKLCPASNCFRPLVKTHGFAMTSYDLMIRFPWYSVDSSSWAKAAGFGTLLVPHMRKGEFTFDERPYTIGMSCDSPSRSTAGRHYSSLTGAERAVVGAWLARVGVPLGEIGPARETIEYGVLSEYNARALANARFFEAMCDALPPYPRPFKARRHAVLFED